MSHVKSGERDSMRVLGALLGCPPGPPGLPTDGWDVAIDTPVYCPHYLVPDGAGKMPCADKGQTGFLGRVLASVDCGSQDTASRSFGGTSTVQHGFYVP